MTASWSKPELERVLAQFQKFDTNGDGTLEEEELAGVLKDIDGKAFNDDAIADMFYAMDKNYDGIVGIEEFLGWLWGDSADAHELLAKVDPPGMSSRAISEMEFLARELRRDLQLFEHLLGYFESAPAARSALKVSVPKGDSDPEEGGTHKEIAFDDYFGGWPGLEKRLRSPAEVLSRFLHEGGTVPDELQAVLLSRRNLVANWKSSLTRNRGGYLLTKGKGGRDRQIVFQLLGLVKPGIVGVHKLDAYSSASPEVKALVSGDDASGYTLKVMDAIRMLDLIKPALLAARAAELSSGLDEINEIFLQSKPETGQGITIVPTTVRSVPDKRVIARAQTSSNLEEDEEAVSEVESAAQGLAEDLEALQKSGKAAEAQALISEANELLQLMRKGGPVPRRLKPDFCSRRNLIGNWKSRIARSRGAYLITPGRGGREKSFVFQLVEKKDGRNLSVLRLDACDSAPSDIRDLATKDSSGTWTIPINESLPLLDLVSPAPLAAKATTLSSLLEAAM